MISKGCFHRRTLKVAGSREQPDSLPLSARLSNRPMTFDQIFSSILFSSISYREEGWCVKPGRRLVVFGWAVHTST